MKRLVLVAGMFLTGCITPKEPTPLASRDCPPLPLLAERPTSVERKAWTDQVIALYVQCANSRGHP